MGVVRAILFMLVEGEEAKTSTELIGESWQDV